MFFWYIGVSVLLVHTVFRSVGIDYRLIALGALLPLILDVPWLRPASAHTMAFPTLLLIIVMVATIGQRKLLRRQLLCIPIGVFVGVLLSGAWMQPDVFWWPAGGWTFPPGSLLATWWVVVLEELAGLIAIWWMIGVGSLYEPGPRRVFLRTGRIALTTTPPSIPASE
jgi:hypothetical protein